MELGDFESLRGLDNNLLGFWGVDGGKRLKAKAIDLGRSGYASTPAFGRAVAPFGAGFYSQFAGRPKAKALGYQPCFRSECIDLLVDRAEAGSLRVVALHPP